MDLKTAISSIGLAASAVGVYIVYRNSPLNFDGIDGGGASTNWEAIRMSTARRNLLVKLGVWAVLGGTLLQMVSNVIPASS